MVLLKFIHANAAFSTVGEGKFVKFAPLIAGNVPVKFPAGKLVSDAPEPEKVVAVQVPVIVTPPEAVVNFVDPLWLKVKAPS